MNEQGDIDEERITHWCARQIDGFRGPARLTKFATGQSNPTYRLDSAGETYVLRAKPPGKLLKSAHLVEREYRVMAALAKTAVPVPKVVALAEDDESPIGRAFFVMAHLDGRIFWDPMIPDVDAAERGAIYDAMNRTLCALHDVDVDTVGLSDFGKPGNYFARQTERWSQQYLATAAKPAPDMRFLIDWLTERLPQDDGTVSLVHGDYRLDNMIFAPDRPEVIGLLDWELATLGHPLADLAYQCMQWRLPHGGAMRGLGGADKTALCIPDETGYVAQYSERRGIGTIENWPFYIVFAFFRLAAILEGVVHRANTGNASNPETGRRFSEVIPVLTALAMEEARRAG